MEWIGTASSNIKKLEQRLQTVRTMYDSEENLKLKSNLNTLYAELVKEKQSWESIISTHNPGGHRLALEPLYNSDKAKDEKPMKQVKGKEWKCIGQVVRGKIPFLVFQLLK